MGGNPFLEGQVSIKSGHHDDQCIRQAGRATHRHLEHMGVNHQGAVSSRSVAKSTIRMKD
jgi:hypothetical protein